MKEGVDNVGSSPAQKAAEVVNPLERRQYILILVIALLIVTLVVTNTDIGHWMKRLAGRLGSVLSKLADNSAPETDHVEVNTNRNLAVTTVET